MADIWLPNADLSQRYDQVKTLQGINTEPDIVVLHTTESGGWPAYSGGGTAPNITYWNSGKFRQHFPLNMSSRSLKNLAGGVQTNGNRVIQIEMVGTCDPSQKDKMFFWPEADKESLDKLAAFLHTICQLTAVPYHFTVKPWVSYPGSYGNSPARMSFAEWDAFSGICGHQHVPENDHGDPGNLSVDYLSKFGAGVKTPTAPEKKKVLPKMIQFNYKGSIYLTNLSNTVHIAEPGDVAALEAVGYVQVKLSEATMATLIAQADPIGQVG